MPHFVVISFYKMFGYPTGLGALLVHREHAYLLHKKYFGGGTVEFASDSSLFVKHRKKMESKFEDGTLDYYSILSLQWGLQDIERFGGMASTEERCFQLALTTRNYLLHLKHANGRPVTVIYGWNKAQLTQQGPLVNFNLLREDGSWVGFVEVEKMANLFGLEMRTGCFCNQGACGMHLGLQQEALKQELELGKVCGDELDLGENGRPLGSVRISFGRTSVEEDVEVFQKMIECCFVSQNTIEKRQWKPKKMDSYLELGKLTHLLLYPIKSCGAVEPRKWKLGASGMLYDRSWMIVSGKTGIPLNQKRFPVLCQIAPKINEQQHKLELVDKLGRLQPLEIELTHIPTEINNNKLDKSQLRAQVCTNSFDLFDYSNEKIRNWFSDLHPSLENNDCYLVGKAVGSVTDFLEAKQSFTNQGDFLLITRCSIEAVSQQTSLPWQTVMRRFRPNLVIDTGSPKGEKPFQEDNFKELHMGSVVFEVTGLCTRCQMICIDQETGEKDPNLLLSLRDLRQETSQLTSTDTKKLTFGVYLSLKKNGTSKLGRAFELRVGSPVRIIYK